MVYVYNYKVISHDWKEADEPPQNNQQYILNKKKTHIQFWSRWTLYRLPKFTSVKLVPFIYTTRKTHVILMDIILFFCSCFFALCTIVRKERDELCENGEIVMRRYYTGRSRRYSRAKSGKDKLLENREIIMWK